MNSLKEEYFACLALRHTPGLGPKSWSRILKQYNSAYAALKDSSNWVQRGLSSDACADNAAKELWRAESEKEYKEAMRLGFGILPWTHPLFPVSLKEIPDPPTYLYYYGDPALLGNPSVGIVGSRKSSRLGLDYARRISGELSRNGVTVVSGFARGIDGCAHKEALKGIGSTIAVLGTGLDIENYPADSEDLRTEMIGRGLVVSEFSPGTRPYAGNFPFRNRIISGLSVGVLVVEADIASGSLITARLAAEQGREVMALPGPIGEKNFSGCLKLIKEGAALVETAEDVLMNIRHSLSADNDMNYEAKTVCPLRSKVMVNTVKLSSENNSSAASLPAKAIVDISTLKSPESEIASVLNSGGKLHIDEIARSAGVDVSLAGSAILGMEIKGIVVRFPGMYYDLNRC
ncbi:DNA-processing protein DprA [Maridesulfovibrio zosterae]|uniref:DNA-processing protein DprA n=1 Tax=Maridesulfovibrio zosterae TaxID=82171 RepID=UPI0003FEAA3C|nr:DNA-processing protein DprA [Maridesulfovibrio zosterae]